MCDELHGEIPSNESTNKYKIPGIPNDQQWEFISSQSKSPTNDETISRINKQI